MIRLNGAESIIHYKFMNPPEVLTRIDAFTTGVIDALNNCVSNDDIEIDTAECTIPAN